MINFIFSPKKVFAFIALLTFGPLTNAMNEPWTPPIGIPAPSFGINETHYMYANATYYYNGVVGPYKDAGNGPYTHYVNNTAPNCDDNNVGGFGDENNPRCTLGGSREGLANFQEGSVVEVHGGPYEHTRRWNRFIFEGSAENPIFFRGFSETQRVQLFRDPSTAAISQLRFEGQYYIIENLDFYQGVLPQIRNQIIPNPHHISFRNLEVHGNGQNEINTGVGLSSGAADDVVIYNNHIHHNIRVDNKDLHGTSAGSGSERVWIVDNHIHHNSGDAFQAAHRASFDRGRIPPRFIFVGRNIMHEDRENGIDLKTIRDVIVSENIIYGYQFSQTSGGDAIVVGSNGVDSTLDGIGPDNAWFLFNEVYDSWQGARFEGVFSGAFIGNVFHDLDATGINYDIDPDSQAVRIIGNTFANMREGIHHHWRCPPSLNSLVEDNIFYNMEFFSVAISKCLASQTTLGNNLFWQDGNPVYFARGYNTYKFNRPGAGPIEDIVAKAESRRFEATGDIIPTLNANGLAFTGSGNFIGDPSFADPLTNYAISAGSSALDQTSEHAVYQEFFDLYGIDIRVDHNGNPRPLGGAWDLGAYEYTDGSTPLPLPEPEPEPEPTDTTAPVVSITSPIDGDTVADTISISADASDNTGVVGVQFRLDGNTLGNEDTLSPYSVSLDTTTLTDGSHTLGATARDAAGNEGSAFDISIDVRNVVPPPPTSELPVVLRSTTPEEMTIAFDVIKPADANSVQVTADVYDADFATEGELYINGNGPVALFENADGSKDRIVTTENITSEAAWWVNGTNSLRFVHTSTGGFRIDSLDVSFDTSTPLPPPPAPACSDGVDNDGDSLTDYPNDPGCSSATDNDETDPLPPPPLPPTGDWTPPIGIPEPPFGIHETHMMYDGQSGYSDAGNGPYTHYIDNTASNCSNSSNGSVSQPMCNIPTNLAAGDVIEIHGGPYVSIGAISAAGTTSQPAFFRGVDDGNGRLIVQGSSRNDFTGSYLIVENIHFHESRLRVITADHISIRNSEINNHPSSTGVLLVGTDLVTYNNEIHHHQGNDRHGLTVGTGSQRIWVLDNDVHHNGGDGIQFCHNCSTNYPEYVYIGRNTFHSDRENAVDFKYGRNIVVSQNTMYGYRSAARDTYWCYDDNSYCGVFSSGSDGSAVVIGSDRGPQNVWVLFNHIYNSNNGIRIEEVCVTECETTYPGGIKGAWIIGNIIHDNLNYSFALEKRGNPVYVLHNIFDGDTEGIIQTWRNNFDLDIQNNIFNDLGTSLNFDREISEASNADNNIFYNNGFSINIRWWQDMSFASTADMAGNFPGGANNLVENPRFADTNANDFHIQEGSPAIGAGTLALVAQNVTFQQLFGDSVSLLYDFDGNPRVNFDIGAYEYTDGPTPPK